MEKDEWMGMSVQERMDRCYNEASKIENYSAEQKAILAIGLYEAYRHKWGD